MDRKTVLLRIENSTNVPILRSELTITISLIVCQFHVAMMICVQLFLNTESGAKKYGQEFL